GHRAFIDALQSAFDTLGGALWREKHQEERVRKRKAKDEERSKALAKMKAEAGPEGVDPAFDFVNQFEGLQVEQLAAEEEQQLEELATQDVKPMDGSETLQPAAGKSKQKAKPRRAPVEPLHKYKVKSETEAYFVICFFVKDVINLRRYMRNIWRQVGLGQIHCAVAGALSNMAVGMMKELQYELAMDYPGCTYYRAIISQLVRHGDYTIIGATAPANGTPCKGKTNARQLALTTNGDTAAIEENLLLTTHNDLVSFITDYRKNRTGKPTSTYAKTSWSPNFRDTKFTLDTELTPQNIRKWRADYTISWLYDLVNSYAAERLRSDAPKMVNPEKLDWDCGESGKCEWTSRPLWGPVEFAYDITSLAMQKPNAAIEEALKPHHILQLQIAVDSMFCAKRWVAQDVPPIDCFGSSNSTLVWDFGNDAVEARRLRDQWMEATIELMDEFKADQVRKGKPTEWSYPLQYLEQYLHDMILLGENPVVYNESAPRSLFSNSSKNGLWLYSPYLCGTGMVDMLNMSYDWNGHLKQPISPIERLLEIFKEDVFRGGQRPENRFFDALQLSLDVRAQYLGDPKKRRLGKGGDQWSSEGSHFRAK
ncbi:MAG: hypothetical protein Q9224_005856, partial [Gallowayella concinna]